MKFKIANFALTTIVLLLNGCVSGYSSFYKPYNGVTPEAIASKRAAPPPETPFLEIAEFEKAKEIIDIYARRGFVIIGQSSFNSGRNESEADALKQGRTVGADLVLVLNPRYTGSVTTSVPITTPTTTTSYTSSSATAYGSGGTVNAYGHATTITNGSETNYIPVTVNRSDYLAVYLIKQRFLLGLFFRDLNDRERQELQTNQGVVVQQVIDDSPAFKSDILTGDIISVLDGVLVANQAGLERIIDERKGKVVTIGLIRRGKRIDKTVNLNN